MNAFRLAGFVAVMAGLVAVVRRSVRPIELPLPGPNKRDPEQMDRMLDKALEASMSTSDPVATVQPDVK